MTASAERLKRSTASGSLARGKAARADAPRASHADYAEENQRDYDALQAVATSGRITAKTGL